MTTAVRNGRYRRGAPICLRRYKGGVAVDRPRAADDFATTRARIEELRRERQGEDSANRDLQSGQPRRGLAVADIAIRDAERVTCNQQLLLGKHLSGHKTARRHTAGDS